MTKYKEAQVTGEIWKRASQITIENPYNDIPSIFFNEEVVVKTPDSVVISRDSSFEEQFTLEKAHTSFPIRNPETEEITTATATFQDVYVLIHSLYHYLARERDKGPQPYPSWIYNDETKQWESPVPIPTDGRGYVWDEYTQSWVYLPDEE